MDYLEKLTTFASVLKPAPVKPFRMRHKIIIASMIVLTALSCQKAFVAEDDPSAGNTYSLQVSGTVTDIETALPLESIRLTFDAHTFPEKEHLAEYSKVVYTDSNGAYKLTVNRLQSSITYTITVEDLDDIYMHHLGEISVDMNGPSFIDGTFYVNDFNIWLKEK